MGNKQSTGQKWLKKLNADAGFSVEDAKKIFAQYDTNLDDVLDRKEAEAFFTDYCKAKKVKPNQTEMNRLFALFDTDRDGRITWAELNRLDLPGLKPTVSTERKRSEKTELRQKSGLLPPPPSDTTATPLNEIFSGFSTDPDWPDHICNSEVSSGLDEFMVAAGITGAADAEEKNPQGNAKTLYTLYMCQASTAGEISRDEFKTGFSDCKSIEEIKAKINNLYAVACGNRSTHQAFYLWSFDYLLDKESGHSALAATAAVDALDILDFWGALPKFKEFVQEGIASGSLDYITKDSWTGLYPYARACLPDLSNHDDLNDGMLPTIIDEFIEWYDSKYAEE
jgi:hypothetical protein